MSFFDKTVDRTNINSVKWNKDVIKNLTGNENALPFWVADMDFVSEEHIIEKAKQIADVGSFGYPEFADLIPVFTSWLSQKHSWRIDNDDVTYTMGLLHGIALAIDLFTKEGDKILIPSPTYRPFRELCEFSGRTMVDYPLGYKDGIFSLDRKRFENALEGIKVILFCSPHNPSGLVFQDSDLKFILSLAKKKNIIVLSDEIHGDLVHPPYVHIPMGKANHDIGAKVITYMAPSKTFNVAGEHMGFAIFSDKEMRDAFIRKQKALWVTTPGYLIGELGRSCYIYGLEYNKALCSYLKENAEYISTFLKENIPDAKLVNGNASYVTFIDLSAYYDRIREKVEKNIDRYKGGDGGGILSRFFGIEGDVCFNDGTWFGDDYYAFIRFNYGTSREMVKKGLEGIRKALLTL